MTVPQADAVDTWRGAVAAWRAAMAAEDEACGEIAREFRELCAAAAGRKAGKLEAAPVGPCSAVDLQRLSAAWWAALPAAARAAVPAPVDALAARVAAAREAVLAARRAADEAAARVPGPVVGDGAGWRPVRDAWPSSYSSQGWGAAGYARASAELAARDLAEVGYRVRTVARLHPPGAGGRGGPVRAFEVWAWTCEEGREIARHQRPARTYADELRRAAAAGVNPTALFGALAAPIEEVAAAGADRSVALLPPLTWERLDPDEPLPG